MKKKKFKIKIGLSLIPIREQFSANGDEVFIAKHYKFLRWQKMRESIMNGKVGDRVRCPSAIWDEYGDYLAEILDTDERLERYVRVSYGSSGYKITGRYRPDEITIGENEYEDIPSYAGVKGKKLY